MSWDNLDLRTPTADDVPRVILDSGEYPIALDLDSADLLRWHELCQAYERLRAQAATGDLDDHSAATMQESVRQQVVIVCPGIPQSELTALSFLKMLRIALHFRSVNGL